MFVNTFWSLVPPIVAIGLALLTKETYSSLFIGIVVGALLATDFSPIGALDTIINDGLTAAIADNAGIFLFLVILGVISIVVGIVRGDMFSSATMCIGYLLPIALGAVMLIVEHVGGGETKRETGRSDAALADDRNKKKKRK